MDYREIASLLNPRGSLSKDALRMVSGFVAQRMGLHFPPERWPDLERGLAATARELHISDLDEYVRLLLSDSDEAPGNEILASHLTAWETFFFRDADGLDAFEHHVLPDLLARPRSAERCLRIWSAGCRTGEEPYSLAMLLAKRALDRQGWDITIIASDINTRFLAKATEGEYADRSFRGAPEWMKAEYFEKTGKGRWRICRKIRDMVRFRYLNLAEDAYPSIPNNIYGLDVIFCRNVLMYFVPEVVRKILDGFHRSLVNEGSLILAPSDFLNARTSPFRPVREKSPVWLKKASQPLPTLREPPGPPSIVAPSPGNPQPAPSRKRSVARPHAAARPEATAEPEDLRASAGECYRRGLYDQAIQVLLEPAAPERNRSVEEMDILARSYANLGDLGRALEWCDEAIRKDKVSPSSYCLRADILQERGETEQAIASLRRALFLDPGFILAHFMLGSVCRSLGKRDEAEKHFQNALRALDGRPGQSDVPGSEGITAGRLRKIVDAMMDGTA